MQLFIRRVEKRILRKSSIQIYTRLYFVKWTYTNILEHLFQVDVEFPMHFRIDLFIGLFQVFLKTILSVYGKFRTFRISSTGIFQISRTELKKNYI